MSPAKRAYEPVILPPVGSVFLMPLADGRYGACRVIRHDQESGGVPFGMVRALVVASRWIGTEAPSLDESLLRQPLVLTHHSWRNRAQAFFASDNVPVDFQLLGTTVPTDEDLGLECLTSTSWESARLQVLLQWRWDNDRDALVAEDELQRQQERAAALERQRERQKHLATLTLDKLKDKQRFVAWGGVNQGVIEVCRHVFAETIDALMEFEGKPRKRKMVSILQECVERLNQLDSERHFIETIEREELCQEIDEIVVACGFPKDVGIADRWREW